MKFMELLFENDRLTREKHRCYGMHRGYYITSEVMDYDIFGIVQYQTLTETDMQRLVGLATSIQQSNKRCNIVVKPNFTQIHIGTPSKNKKMCAILEGCIDGIINYLQSLGAASGCANCGSVEPLVINLHDEIPMYVCPNCLQKINEQVQIEASKPKVKSSLIPGLVGAFLGSLAGVIVWVIIYQLGYISAISGMIMAVGALWGYEKLGKSLDLKGIIVSVVIVLGMVYFTNRLCWTIELMKVDDFETLSFGDAFRNLESGIKAMDDYAAALHVNDFHLFADYIKDLLIGYAFVIIGIVSMVVNAIKSRRR